VSCIDRTWALQDPTADFKPQLWIGLAMVFEAIVVLTAIAVAASTRLGRIATLVICIAVFLAGLVGEYFLSLTAVGRRLLPALAAVVPNFQFFWPADAITQEQPIPLWHLGWVSGYAVLLSMAALALAVTLFQGRDVG
jgi:hypothetical protein